MSIYKMDDINSDIIKDDNRSDLNKFRNTNIYKLYYEPYIITGTIEIINKFHRFYNIARYYYNISTNNEFTLDQFYPITKDKIAEYNIISINKQEILKIFVVYIYALYLDKDNYSYIYSKLINIPDKDITLKNLEEYANKYRIDNISEDDKVKIVYDKLLKYKIFENIDDFKKLIELDLFNISSLYDIFKDESDIDTIGKTITELEQAMLNYKVQELSKINEKRIQDSTNRIYKLKQDIFDEFINPLIYSYTYTYDIINDDLPILYYDILYFQTMSKIKFDDIDIILLIYKYVGTDNQENIIELDKVCNNILKNYIKHLTRPPKNVAYEKYISNIQNLLPSYIYYERWEWNSSYSKQIIKLMIDKYINIVISSKNYNYYMSDFADFYYFSIINDSKHIDYRNIVINTVLLLYYICMEFYNQYTQLLLNSDMDINIKHDIINKYSRIYRIKISDIITNEIQNNINNKSNSELIIYSANLILFNSDVIRYIIYNTNIINKYQLIYDASISILNNYKFIYTSDQITLIDKELEKGEIDILLNIYSNLVTLYNTNDFNKYRESDKIKPIMDKLIIDYDPQIAITAISSPNPAQSSPNPAQSSPNPAQSSPNPAQSSLSPAQSSPSPAQSSPSPAQSSPSPAQSSLSPAQSSPSPAQSSPNPAQSSLNIKKNNKKIWIIGGGIIIVIIAIILAIILAIIFSR